MVRSTRVANSDGPGSSASRTGDPVGGFCAGSAVALPVKKSRLPAAAAAVVSAVQRHRFVMDETPGFGMRTFSIGEWNVFHLTRIRNPA
jgi:hypothetical protein